MSDDSPTLGDLFEGAFRKALGGLRTWLPGEIRAYDADLRRATVQVMVPDGWFDELGQRQTTTLQPLTDVPVAMTGSGSMRFRYPIRPGDPCIVLFSSSCLTAYKATGRLLDAKDDRHHHEADAIAIPMQRVVGDVEDESMIVFLEDGKILAGGSEDLALKKDVSDIKSAVSALLNTLASAGTSPVTGSAVATAKTDFDSTLAAVPAGTDILKGS